MMISSQWEGFDLRLLRFFYDEIILEMLSDEMENFTLSSLFFKKYAARASSSDPMHLFVANEFR